MDNKGIYAVVDTLDAGYDSDKAKMDRLGLKVGEKYEVDFIDMGGGHTDITLTKFPNEQFNSVFFEFEENGEELDIFDDKRFNPYR